MKKRTLTLVLVIIFFLPPLTTHATTQDDLLAQIQQLLGLVSSLQTQLLALGEAPTTTQTNTLNLTRTLYIGIRGDDVRQLQEFLRSTGDFTYTESTGYYGNVTAEAVKRWQARNNVVSSGTPETTGYGVVGPKTRGELAKRGSITTNPIAIVTPTPQSSPTPTPQRSSTPTPQPTTYDWEITNWGTCSNSAQIRYVTCMGSDAKTYADSMCSTAKPISTQSCAAPFSVANFSTVLDTNVPVTNINLLWGRHSSKYVKVGSYIYATLSPEQEQPLTASIYRFNEKDPDSGWVRVWQGPNDVHQPPILLVDKNNILHLIYSKFSIGTIEHRVFSGATSGNLVFGGFANTTAWGNKNFYLGASRDATQNAIYLCTSNFVSSVLRCGTYTSSAWPAPQSVASYSGNTYLYPGISGRDGSFFVTLSANPDNLDSSQRSLNALFFLSGGGNNIVSDRSKTIRDNRNGETTLMEADLIMRPDGSAYLLATDSGGTQESGALRLFILRKDRPLEKRDIPGLDGRFYNMVIDQAGIINVIGEGKYARSQDDGVTWEYASYEDPSYPVATYKYGIAHTLKNENSGGNSFDDGIASFLQEVIHRSTGLGSVLSITLDSGSLNFNSGLDEVGS